MTEKELVEIARSLKTFQAEWPYHLEIIAFKARMARARYLALRKEGFDVREALDLCISDVRI
jgi:hypothetical protein